MLLRRTQVWTGMMVSILLVAALVGCPNRGGKNSAQIQTLTFAANGTTDLDINCSGNAPTAANLKLYTPQVVLSRAMDVTRTLAFVAKEDRRFASDPTLAAFTMVFNAGSTSPTSMSTPANAGADVTPPGTPDPETQGFWLTCTTGCKVRGNAGRGDDGHARVYLQLLELQPASSSNIVITGKLDGTRRTVRCK